MTNETKPVHSSRGASGMERWANCPGSVNLIKSITPIADAADPEYRVDGTAAHAALAFCLEAGSDAWEVVGEKFGEPAVEVTSDMADAIQVFIDEVRPLAEGAEKVYVETHMNNPDNDWEFGTIDFGAIKDGTAFIRDYKHGMGSVVETKGNFQLLYYAHLLLLLHPDVRRINMRIRQPRVPYRNDDAWEISAEELAEWAEKVLFPAAKRCETDDTLSPGEHCRFCEAKNSLACPALKDAFKQLTDDHKQGLEDKATVEQYMDASLLADWKLTSPMRMHIKAIEAEVMRRLMAGKMRDNGVVKLVNKKADRVWKPEAPELFKTRFGQKAMSVPELLSPAQMEKIDAAAKKMVHEYAYTPQVGYTVADADDKRPGVTVQSVTEAFEKTVDSL